MRKSHRAREPCFTTELTDSINKIHEPILGGKKYGATLFDAIFAI